MAAPREYTDAFIIIKKLFLGGLRGLQSNSIQYERPCKVCSSFCWSLADSVRFHRQLAFKIVAIFRRMSNIYVVPYPALLGMEFVRTQELDEEISYLLTLPAAGNPGKLSL